MSEKTPVSQPDWAAIRRDAEAAARDLLDHRWDAYMAMVRRIEERPENRSGADKTWVSKASAAWREHYRNARKVE